MKKYIFSLAITLIPLLSFAHNTLSARYHIEIGEKVSMLSVNLSQTGVNQALLKKYGEERFITMDQLEMKQFIVDYVKNSFDLSIDKDKIQLKEGGIKLGSHQTDLKFVLPPFSPDFNRIDVSILAFSENDNHQTIFSYQTLDKADHVILSKHNNFKSSIMLHKKTTVKAFGMAWYWFFSVLLVFLAMTYFVLSRGRKQNLSLVLSEN